MGWTQPPLSKRPRRWARTRVSRRWLRPLDIRLVIRGDMAFLTAESTFTVKVLPSSDSESALLSGRIRF